MEVGDRIVSLAGRVVLALAQALGHALVLVETFEILRVRLRRRELGLESGHPIYGPISAELHRDAEPLQRLFFVQCHAGGWADVPEVDVPEIVCGIF